MFSMRVKVGGKISWISFYNTENLKFSHSCKTEEYTVYSFCSGNHERDWPNTGSFYDTPDSGGECGVPAETLYYYPAENRAKFW